jgi:hypothetical protein
MTLELPEPRMRYEWNADEIAPGSSIPEPVRHLVIYQGEEIVFYSRNEEPHARLPYYARSAIRCGIEHARTLGTLRETRLESSTMQLARHILEHDDHTGHAPHIRLDLALPTQLEILNGVIVLDVRGSRTTVDERGAAHWLEILGVAR